MTSHPCVHVVACICESERYTMQLLQKLIIFFCVCVFVWTVFIAHSAPNVSFYFSVVPGINAGTTSTVALLRDGIELVVASVGDSRAMLCRKGKALKLTVDHTPDRRDEKERYQDVVNYATGFICRVLEPVGMT